jgi:hypothetical protein
MESKLQRETSPRAQLSEADADDVEEAAASKGRKERAAYILSAPSWTMIHGHVGSTRGLP